MKTTEQYMKEVETMALDQLQVVSNQAERAKGYQMAMREIIAFAGASKGDPGTLASLIRKLEEMNQKPLNEF